MRPPWLVALSIAAASSIACGHPLSVPRAYHEAVTLGDGGILVIGGGHSYPSTAIVGRYEPDRRRWIAAAMLPEGIDGHQATLLLDGRVLVTGGDGLDVMPRTEALLYDPLADRWRDAAPMRWPRRNHAAARLGDGRVLVVGGDGVEARAEVYDPISNTWRDVAPPPSAVQRHTATALTDGRVLVVGELDGREPAVGLLYDPRADAWSETGPLAEARAFHTATALADGRLIVVGGRAVLGGMLSDQALASIEIFDPRLDAWRRGPSLCHARSGHTATLLGDRLWIAGGVPSGYGTQRAIVRSEIFVIGEDAIGLGPRVSARAEHSASALDDGSVMLVGGRRRVIFNHWTRRWAERVVVHEPLGPCER